MDHEGEQVDEGDQNDKGDHDDKSDNGHVGLSAEDLRMDNQALLDALRIVITDKLKLDMVDQSVALAEQAMHDGRPPP